MSSSLRRLSLGALVLSMALLISGAFQAGTLAQDTPSQIGPVTPLASACTAEPRTAEELVALFANSTPADPMPIETSATIELGQPADAVSAQQITTVIHEAFACLNAGDFARFFSLLTDHAIVIHFPWMAEALSDEASAADALAINPPASEYLQTILGIGSIARLSGGSYSAVVVYQDPNAGDQPSAIYLTFVQVGGEWRVDRAVDFHLDS